MQVIMAYGLNTLVNVGVGLVVALALGPEAFGRFALALGLAAIVQMLLLEWTRYAAQRFVSGARGPDVVACLRTSFVALALLLSFKFALILGLAFVLPTDAVVRFLPLGLPMVGLMFALTILNGLFDLCAAVLRARFEDGRYARLMGIKNAIALALTPAAAFWFRSAEVTVACVGLAMLGGVLVTFGLPRPSLPSINLPRPLQFGKAPFQWVLLQKLLRYAVPLVLTNAMYLGLPLATRAWLALRMGYAESGQFSLAYDITSRLVMALGLALDVVLFQLAVRAESAAGKPAADAQLLRNALWVLAVLATACLGVWLVLPSLQSLFVPQAFQGPFATYVTLLLPGLAAWGMATYGLHAVLQMAHRTPVLVGLATLVCGLNGITLWLLPATATAFQTALVLSGFLLLGALCVGVSAWLCGLRQAAQKQPVAGTFCKLAGALFAMALSVGSLRGSTPGLVTLLMQMALGMAVTGLMWWGLDILQIRGEVHALWTRLRQGRTVVKRER